MPIYEYLCNKCKKKFSYLYGVVAEKAELVCPRCKSVELTRIFSRFATARSEEERLESLADPSKFGDIESPEGMRRWIRKMSKELGDELGEDFEEVVEEELAREEKETLTQEAEEEV